MLLGTREASNHNILSISPRTYPSHSSSPRHHTLVLKSTTQIKFRLRSEFVTPVKRCATSVGGTVGISKNTASPSMQGSNLNLASTSTRCGVLTLFVTRLFCFSPTPCSTHFSLSCPGCSRSAAYQAGYARSGLCSPVGPICTQLFDITCLPMHRQAALLGSMVPS